VDYSAKKNGIMSFAGKWMDHHVKKPNITCSYPFVKLRPKMMMMIMGHECKRGMIWREAKE
jgi:hypothetical protein